MTTQFFINTSFESPERLDLGKVLDSLGGYDPLTSRFLNDLEDVPLEGFRVTVDEAERPDLVSNKIYGDTQYWWVLMFVNFLTDPRELTTGTVLKIPPLAEIEAAFFSLKSRQSAQGT